MPLRWIIPSEVTRHRGKSQEKLGDRIRDRPERMLIYDPNSDDTYWVELRTADGESLAIRVPAGEPRPPAYSVSEREANDQTDCNFQHSDKRAWAVTRTPPERTKRLKGGVLRDPRRVPA
jgi:hypothetical protein